MKVLEINKEDLEYNINLVKKRAKDKKIIAVVKGNGYGLGLKEFSKTLIKSGISDLAVSSVEEAIELASFKLNARILCLEATAVEAEIEKLIENNIIVSIGSKKCAETVEKVASKAEKKAHAHLAIDTGFSRYGFFATEKEAVLETIQNSKKIYFDGVFSHLSTAYFQDDFYVRKQYSLFLDIKKYLEENDVKIPIYHICNSSAFLKYEDMYLDAVRVGSVFSGRISVKNNIGLKKIGMLKSNVVEIKEIKKGTPVGYSNSDVVKKDTKIAIIPVGYSDGFNIEITDDTHKFVDKLRRTKNSCIAFLKDDRKKVTINGKKYNIIGKIGMNHSTVDVTGEDVEINDEVLLDISPMLVNSKIRREYI